MANRARDRRDVPGWSENGVSAREPNRAELRQSAPAECSGQVADFTSCWPRWAQVVVSLALVFHVAAVLAGAWAVPPSSSLERAFADLFIPYFDLVDLGYSYRFYTEPPPTPVVTATLHFGPARADELVRLPARNLPGPRLRHQRQLALANALFQDVVETRERSGHATASPLARAYARHLCRKWPDCQSVTLHLQHHLIPEPEVVSQATSTPGAAAYDLFDESLFSTPEWIGDFPCDAF